MPPTTAAIDLLGHDLVSIAQCIAIDADVFPYPSADFTARSSRHRTWIARAMGSGRVVGFLASREQRGLLQVQGLAVDVGARQRGIGRALVRACLQSDLAARAETVTLSVSVLNRAAIALYESEGFVVVRRARNHYPESAYGPQRDAFTMRRRARGEARDLAR